MTWAEFSQHALTQGAGVPGWGSGASFWLDAIANRGQDSGAAITADGRISVTRASPVYAPNAAGSFLSFASGVIARTDRGVQSAPSQNNLFANAFAPGTQTITVAAATTYTVSITGPGSIALSGAGTGTVVAGTPVTFVAGTTSLTLTVTGSPSTCNVVADTFATGPIQTAGSPVATSADQLQLLSLGSLMSTGVSGFIQVDLMQPAQDYRRVFSINNGNAANALEVASVSGNFNFDVKSGDIFQINTSIGAWAQGIQTIAFAVGTNYAMARVVGLSAISPVTTVTYPVAPNQVSLGGFGFDTSQNTFSFIRKLALWTQGDATAYANAYAKALLA